MALEQIDANTQLKNYTPGSGGVVLLPFVTYITPMPVTATGFPFVATVDRTLNLVKFSLAVLVLSTNDVSNYYLIRLKRVLDDAVIASFDTSGASPNVYTLLEDTSLSISSISASDVGVYVDDIIQGSPGSMYLGSPILEVTT